jgi:hypothetical protein
MISQNFYEFWFQKKHPWAHIFPYLPISPSFRKARRVVQQYKAFVMRVRSDPRIIGAFRCRKTYRTSVGNPLTITAVGPWT